MFKLIYKSTTYFTDVAEAEVRNQNDAGNQAIVGWASTTVHSET